MLKITRRALAAMVTATALVAGSGAAMAEPVNLTAETSSPGNSPHLSIVHMADILARAGIANLQVQEGQTATNTIVNVAEGKADIASTPLILHFLLRRGAGPYAAQGEKGKDLAANLRVLYPYNSGAYGLFAHQSTGIAKWDDIKGKTIFNGPPRGAALVSARLLIQGATGFKDGEDYKGMQANWGQLPGILVDGSAQGFAVPLTFPSDRITTALAAGKVNLLSVPKATYESDAFQKLLSAPGNTPYEVKAEEMGYGADQGVNLISEDGVFRGMGSAFADTVNKDMDKDLVKRIVKAYIDALPELKTKAPYMGNVGLANLDGKASGFCAAGVKYHPGAIEAWEEAGYTIPDCAR